MTLRSTFAGVALAALTLAAGSAKATVFDFTFTDVISSANTPGIAVGDVFTLNLFADNGGNTDLSQTWNLVDLQGFTIDAGLYHATYSKVFESPTTGNFVTNALGVVTQVQFYGTSDFSNNTDNFGSWTADIVLGNAQFNDFLGAQNSIAAGNLTDDSKWTVKAAGQGGAVPEPATWAMMLVGFGGLGAALRSRKTLVRA